MAARKPKPVVVEPEPGVIEEAKIDGIFVTKDQLLEALRDNMQYKTGSLPIVGQFDDLWRRLTGS